MMSAAATARAYFQQRRGSGIGNGDSGAVLEELSNNIISSSSNSISNSTAPYPLPHIDPPPLHAACTSWVIFSDLHVKAASIDVCEQVLHQVHKAALVRNAGVIFLGDFWHIRGSLDVQVLNRVLKALGQWTQPVIMIPGNHDQVTLGGQVHSLEPLVYAFKPGQMLMIDEPAVCMGALWIPYRREAGLMRRVLKTPTDVSIIFCHADVRGAMMNDNMVSKEGLEISDFPKNIPIFSGHFHKPHIVERGGSSLCYVGSPYQTSLSEAGQSKYFYRVDYCSSGVGEGVEGAEGAGETRGANGAGVEGAGEVGEGKRWSLEEQWEVSIGPKIYKASSPSDPKILQAVAGDRVVVAVPVGGDFEAAELLARLQKQGVDVELKHARNPVSAHRAASTVAVAEGVVALADDLGEAVGAVRRFEEYMAQLAAEPAASSGSASAGDISSQPGRGGGGGGGVGSEGLSKAHIHALTLTEGRATLERLTGTAAAQEPARRTELRLVSVRLQNFGPYVGDPIHYPLSSRGLVLLTGQSKDGTGADSNGAGKTTLAMSVLWGLTGSLDARPVVNESASVVNEGGAGGGAGGGVGVVGGVGAAGAEVKGKSKRKKAVMAEVAVKGMVNGQAFDLVRRRSAKKAELRFTLGGEDLTTQSVKDTQGVVDVKLGIQGGLLQRCCFFGQHAHIQDSLLGLTDVKLKSELSALVDTSLWVAALRDVRAREKAGKDRLAELTVEARVRREDEEKLSEALAESQVSLGGVREELERAEEAGRVGAGAGAGVGAGGEDSVVQLSQRLSSEESDLQTFKNDTLLPLRQRQTEALKSRLAGSKLGGGELGRLGEEVARLRSENNSSSKEAAAAQRKLEQLQGQADELGREVQGLLLTLGEGGDGDTAGALSGVVGAGTGAGVGVGVDPAPLRAALEAVVAEWAQLRMQADAANTSLSRLRELAGGAGAGVGTGGGVGASSHAQQRAQAHSADEACPTCGQELPAESREARAAELTEKLKKLDFRGGELDSKVAFSRKQVDAAQALRGAAQNQTVLQEKMAEVGAELGAHQAALTAGGVQLRAAEAELARREGERLAAEGEALSEEEERVRLLGAAEESAEQLERMERETRGQLEALRLSQGASDRLLDVLRERSSAAQRAEAEKSEALAEVQRVLEENASAARALQQQVTVLECLNAVLGPRGIQNYVFQGVILQLEGIANSYLGVLAQGGIQLSLQGDEEKDTIVKSVWIRSKGDGTFRERGLGQLSGGQWRRVSLSLDFAFAELVRRRGVLRCSLMVLDEVLTHLDASGREAVGTVLRAMVQGPGPAELGAGAGVGGEEGESEEQQAGRQVGALLGGGAYETVIVILQDLAAAELEEAFDHIDLVVKRADASTLLLDGQGEQA